ncbi:hypothetical protein MMC07_006274 [Pseudocyphellaria aurata]|nr:hypothetical protein [Pseudocyphellaria aurata]
MAPVQQPLTHRQLIETQNLSVIDNAAVLQEIMQTLKTLQNEMAAMESRLDAVDHNAQARLLNSDVTRSSDPLIPIKTSTNVIPDGFPMTSSQLNSLSVAQMDVLLAAYSLPRDGGLRVMRRRFTQFIGAINVRLHIFESMFDDSN